MTAPSTAPSSDSLTAAEAVRGVAGPVGQLGGGFMFDPATAERGNALGMPGWTYYHLGRGGAMGDVAPETVVAAFGFFPAALVTKAWLKGLSVTTPTAAAQQYAGSCARYGRRWDDLPGPADAARLAALLGAVNDHAEPMGLALFAGWRALAARTAGEPDVTDGGRLALALMAARELRGGLHLLAVRACGVTPLEALVSGRNGPGNAEFFGWPQPWPDAGVASDRMAEAERLTDVLAEQAFEGLSGAERAELVTGLRALRERASAT